MSSVLGVANVANRIEAYARLRRTGCIAVEVEDNLARAIGLTVFTFGLIVALNYEIVPTLLLGFQIELGAYWFVCYLVHHLDVGLSFVNLNVGTCALDALNKHTLLTSIKEAQRKNHPEGNSPLVQNLARAPQALGYLNHVAKVEEGSPAPVEALTFRNLVRLAPDHKHII